MNFRFPFFHKSKSAPSQKELQEEYAPKQCESYVASLHFYSDDAYNVPLNTIYYLESTWNYRQNNFVRNNLSAIEAYVNDYANPHRKVLGDYTLVYVSRQNTAAWNALRELYPDLQDAVVEDPSVDDEARFCKGKKKKLKDKGYKLSFLTRLYPAASSSFAFVSFDTELLTVGEILSALCDFVLRASNTNYSLLYEEAGRKLQWSSRVFSSLFKAVLGTPADKSINWGNFFSDIDDGVRFSIAGGFGRGYAPPSPAEQERIRRQKEEEKCRKAEAECTRLETELDRLQKEEKRRREEAEQEQKNNSQVRFSLDLSDSRPIYREAPYENESMIDFAGRIKEYNAGHKEEVQCAEAQPKPKEGQRKFSFGESGKPCYRDSEHPNETVSDYSRRLDEYGERLKEEMLREKALAIKAEIEQLQRSNGISIFAEILGQELISQLRRSHPAERSPLVVDEHYRILLTAYNMEIPLSTLPKALYFLFLRHPEGLQREQLDACREELRTIYLTLSGRTDLEAMDRSINDLVEPGSDSLNQKISRINAAFRNHLASDLAGHYMITGPRGEAKKVEIASSVTLPAELRF